MYAISAVMNPNSAVIKIISRNGGYTNRLEFI